MNAKIDTDLNQEILINTPMRGELSDESLDNVVGGIDRISINFTKIKYYPIPTTSTAKGEIEIFSWSWGESNPTT